MRVISGKYGSRRLKAVQGDHTRPTTDKIKESIFNLLGGSIDGGQVLDFYGGSGALAIEAVSRGADMAVICENYRPAVRAIQDNILITKEDQRFKVLVGDNYQKLKDYLQACPTLKFSLVFLDPPYHKEKIIKDIEFLQQLDCLSNETRIICETDNQTNLPPIIGLWKLEKEKKYGQTYVRIYQRGVVE